MPKSFLGFTGKHLCQSLFFNKVAGQVWLKRPGFYTLVLYLFINNSRSKQTKNNPEQPFLDIIKKKTCAKFQQKISNPMVVGARQNFQFFRQKNLVSWK